MVNTINNFVNDCNSYFLHKTNNVLSDCTGYLSSKTNNVLSNCADYISRKITFDSELQKIIFKAEFCYNMKAAFFNLATVLSIAALATVTFGAMNATVFAVACLSLIGRVVMQDAINKSWELINKTSNKPSERACVKILDLIRSRVTEKKNDFLFKHRISKNEIIMDIQLSDPFLGNTLY